MKTIFALVVAALFAGLTGPALAGKSAQTEAVRTHVTEGVVENEVGFPLRLVVVYCWHPTSAQTYAACPIPGSTEKVAVSEAEVSYCWHPTSGQTYGGCEIPVAATESLVQEAHYYVPIQYRKIKFLGPEGTQRNEQFDPKDRQ